MRRQRNDRDQMFRWRQGADLPRGLDAVELRHLHIHQHDVIIAVTDRGDSLMAVLHHGRVVAGLAQQGRHEALIDRVVLGDQDPQRPWPAAGGAGRDTAAGARRRPDAARASGSSNQKVEPAPRRLETPISPPISVDEFPADGQAEAGAAVTAGDRAVRLAEFLEQAGLLALRRCRSRYR